MPVLPARVSASRNSSQVVPAPRHSMRQTASRISPRMVQAGDLVLQFEALLDQVRDDRISELAPALDQQVAQGDHVQGLQFRVEHEREHGSSTVAGGREDGSGAMSHPALLPDATDQAAKPALPVFAVQKHRVLQMI